MPLAENDDMIKAFPSDRADQPFSMSVLPWRSRRSWAVTNAHRSKTSGKYLAVDPVPIADDVSRCGLPTAFRSEFPERPSCSSEQASAARAGMRRDLQQSTRRRSLSWLRSSCTSPSALPAFRQSRLDSGRSGFCPALASDMPDTCETLADRQRRPPCGAAAPCAAWPGVSLPTGVACACREPGAWACGAGCACATG